jgi:hypothetical protein
MMRGKKRNDHITLMQQFEAFGWLTRLDRNGAVPRWLRTKGLGKRFAEDLQREVARRKELTKLIKLATSRRKSGEADEEE